MSLTIIGIIIIVFALLALITLLFLVITKQTTYTVIAEWGVKPVGIREPGWNLVPWPYLQAHDIVPRDVVTYNVPSFESTCQVGNGEVAITTPDRQYGITNVKSGEISLAWNFHFCDGIPIETQLARYYELVERVDEEAAAKLSEQNKIRLHNGTWLDITRLLERFKDIIQRLFREKVTAYNLYKAITIPDKDVREIKRQLVQECCTLGFPVEITDLSANSPFVPSNPAIARALEDRATFPLQMEAQVIQAETERKKAEIGIKTAEAHAKANALSAKTLADLYGISALPPTEKVQAFLTMEALTAYKIMAASPAKTFVISPNILADIKATLATLGKMGGLS